MPEDDPMADGRPNAYIYDPEADAARAAMTVTPEGFGEPELPGWHDDGARLLVPVEVEAVEGWDPSPPLPSDWEPTWYDTEDLMAVLEPELVAETRAARAGGTEEVLGGDAQTSKEAGGHEPFWEE